MDRQVGERRQDPRVAAVACQIEGATLRPGAPVRVLDVSASGAQIESERPLRPGRRVHIRLVAAGETLAMSGVILRCAVWALNPAAGVLYRGALHFDRPCASLGSAVGDERRGPGNAEPEPPWQEAENAAPSPAISGAGLPTRSGGVAL